MESFLPSEIGRLVLGYLEDQKCEEAYETFLRTSPHLEECLKMREEGRKFRTQVMGLNLLNILYEYSAIYSLVHERLKKVDPETANSLIKSGSLLDKLTFLLNATSSGQTMLFSITLPPGKSPSTVAHVRKRLRTTSSSDKKREYLRKHSRVNIDEFSPITELDENMVKPSALETTSLSSLPGNANISLDCTNQLEGSEIVRTPKRKAHLQNSRRSRPNSVLENEDEENLDITALTKALLDNHELHEKIAENINKVIHTPELAAGINVSQIQDLCSAQNPALSETNTTFPNNFTFELDNAVKKIVEDTESDPIFENFLQEVINLENETSDDGEDRGISDTSTPCQSTPETVKKMSMKHRLRSSKKRAESVASSSDLNTPTKIDNQNAAAIESIIQIQAITEEPEPSTSGVQTKPVASKENEQTNETPQLTIAKPSHSHVTNIVEVNSANNITLEEQKKGNSNKNLLTAQRPSPIIIAETPSYQPPIQDNRLVILSSKMTNTGSQILTVQPAQFQTQIFSEDILTMPTVIINDDLNPGNTYIVPQKHFPSIESTTAVKKFYTPPITRNPIILPHPIINTNVTTTPADTITYTLNVQPQPILAKTVENPIPKLVQNSVPKIIHSDPIPKPINNSDPKPSTSKQEDTTGKSVPIILLNSGIKENLKHVTPEISAKKLQLSSSSPRTTRSHIRALDFSTPARENCPRKSLSSPRTRRAMIAKCPQQRQSLFTSPLNLPIATRSPHEKLQGDWDGSELIFGTYQSPIKPKTSERTEDVDENNPAKRLRVTSSMSDKPTMEKEPLKPKAKKSGSWDQDLRAHIESLPMPCKQKRVKRRSKVAAQIAEKRDVKDSANITEEEGQKIETELAKTGNNDSSKENFETQNKTQDTNESTDKSVKVKPAKGTKQKRQPKTKNIFDNEIVESNTLKDKNPRTGKRIVKPRVYKTTKKNATNPEETKIEEIKKTTNVTLSASEITVKQTVTNPEETKIEELKKITNEIITSSEITVKNTVSNPEEIKIEELKKTTNETLTSSEITVNAKKSIMHMLETPLKNDSLMLPPTPGIMTPFGTDASFSNLIKQNCGSVDLSSIITPSFPMTPDLPLTPGMHTGDSQSSYASRPTDYSNSSSYYQPSDTEQNQKIDQVLIEEAMKIEASTLKKQIWTSTPDKEVLIQNKELSVPPTDSMPDSVGDKVNFKSDKSFESSKTNLDNSHTSVSDTSTSSSSSSDADTTKESMRIETEKNTTVIHIPPRKLRRGGKHMAMLERFVKPDNIDIESDNSESYEKQTKVVIPKKIEKNIRQKEKTITSKEKLNKLEEKVNKLREKVNNYEEKVNKQEEHVKTTEDTCKGKKLNSHVTKVHCPLLKELELKRQRTIKELKNEFTKPKAERKGRGRKKIEVSTRVTRSKSNSRKKDKNNKQSETKTEVTEKKEKQSDKQKLSFKRHASIEDVAARLKKDKKHMDAPDDEHISIKEVIPKLKDKNIKTLLHSPNTSIESHDSSEFKESYLIPVAEDEEYRLHISSDEEMNVTVDKTKDEDDLEIVKVLKERGIHLIPNKTPEKKTQVPVNDEDNPNVINTQEVNLNISDNILEQSSDVEDNISLKSIDKKIEIKSCINLDESKKIDVSKIFSHATIDKTESVNRETEVLVAKDKKAQKISQIEEKTEPDPTTQTSNEINEMSLKVVEEAEKLTKMTNDSIKTIEILKDQSISHETEKAALDKELTHAKVHTEDSPEYEIPKDQNMSNKTKKAELDKALAHAKVLTEDSPEYKIPKEQNMSNKTKKAELDKELVHAKVLTEVSPEYEIPKDQNMSNITKMAELDKELTHAKVLTEDSPEYEIPKDQNMSNKTKKADLDKELAHAKLLTEDSPEYEIPNDQNMSKETEKAELDKELAHAKVLTEDNSEHEVPKDQNMSNENEKAELDEELFHVKVLTEDSPEYIHMVHDEWATTQKTIDDYNFDVLKKTISAQVFLEELNIEQERVLSVTPFLEIVTFPAKVPKVLLKPLDILFNELVDDSSVDTLFEAPTKTIKCNKVQAKTPKSSKKSTTKNDSETDKREKQKCNTLKSDSSKPTTKKTISLEQYKNKQNKDTKELEEKVIKKMKEDDDTKLLNSEEDSLFEFAVTGTEKTLKKESAVQDSNLRKRKADPDSSKPSGDKRVKPDTKLLKTINVDQFLSQIHGPTDIKM